MKLTNIALEGKLEFNDLGSYTKGVSPQPIFVNLNPGDAVYLPDSGEAMFSAQAGDAHRYAKAGLLAVNETVTLGAAATYTINHNFGFLPRVTVARLNAGHWQDCGFDVVATVSAVSNAAMTQTVITNVSAGGLTLHIRIS
jgi:hypothetical protein